ncbi:unnamed protein product, partial [Owenia fusiformis]
SKIDTYGFQRSESFDYTTYEEFMSDYLAVLARRAGKWRNVIDYNSKVDRNAKVKRYCRKGIPGEHRAMVWMSISGAEEQMAGNPTLYSTLLEAPQDQELVDTIKQDIHRTFPDNIFFGDMSNPQTMRRPLQNVLIAFAHHNKDIGYCQGLNFITGMLLLVVKDEHKVFWLLHTLVNKYLPDYYSKGLEGLKVDQDVLGQLVKIKAPELYKHMDELGLMWCIVSTKWFICCFADVLPIETVLRIWDSLFYEGSKIIFRVSITLILHNQSKLMKCRHLAEILDTFKEIPKDPLATRCHDFMQSIFKIPGSFPQAQIKSLRKRYKKQQENG